MCRIGGRLRTMVARLWGVTLEIPPLLQVKSNPYEGTVYGG